MYTRRATLDDLPGMRQVAVDSMKLNPLSISTYKGSFGEAYADRLEQVHRGLLEDPKCHCYVAISKVRGGPDQIVGFIGFERIDKDTKDEPANSLGTKGAAYPEGLKVDMVCVTSWKKEIMKMREKFLEERGPFYRCHMLWVSPKVHKTGFGSLLCKHLADQADKEGLPVLLGTTYYTTPFYERFAYLNGYKLDYIDVVTIDAEPRMPKLTIHFIVFDKKDGNENSRK